MQIEMEQIVIQMLCKKKTCFKIKSEEQKQILDINALNWLFYVPLKSKCFLTAKFRLKQDLKINNKCKKGNNKVY